MISMKEITIKVDKEKLKVSPETTLLEVSKKYQHNFKYPILVAKMDNEITNLSRTVTANSEICFYDRSSRVGNEVYVNSLKLLLVVSLRRLFGNNIDVITDFSIDNGVFCQIVGKNITKQDLGQVQQTMKEISSEGLDYIKVNVSRLEAMKYFKRKGN